VSLVRTDVSEEFSASIISVTRIGELGTLAVTSNKVNILHSCTKLLIFTDSVSELNGQAQYVCIYVYISILK
jgi:hypothetical protein